MKKALIGTVVIALALVGTAIFLARNSTPVPVEVPLQGADLVQPAVVENVASSTDVPTSTASVAQPVRPQTQAAPSLANGQKAMSRADLLALAADTYASGDVPLGDYKYVTDAPKKGYIYLCNAHKDNPGSMVIGTWINGDTWNFLKKVAVSGSVAWPNAAFSDVVSSGMRTLSGNGLPISHTTGTFPVQSSDPASKFDSNPNTITAQSLKKSLPADPTYSETPYCMGGEVGIMLSGVPLFNGFDAGLRDAPAHELQDSCEGHPQESGEYHYHSLSSCFKDTDVSTVLGYAYDGFPITGATVAPNKYLTTADLDVCHGITSEVVIDGQKKVTYHYVMTKDFPYSASCFRGKPVSTGPSVSGGPQQQAPTQGQAQQSAPGGQGQQPPQQAIDACSGKQDSSPCSFVSPRGDTVSGVCRTPPGSSLACVPR